MPERLPGEEPPKISTNRIIIWIIVGGVGIYLVVTGIIGIVQAG